MRQQSVPPSSLPTLLALLLSMSLLGCLTNVDAKAGAKGAACAGDKNCREGLVCVHGTCQGFDSGDAGTDATGDKSDGSSYGHDAISDMRTDVGSRQDATTLPDMRTDSSITEKDAPVEQPDGSAANGDGPAPDAPGLEDTRAAETSHPDAKNPDTHNPDTLPCNGGCCSSADCPLSSPVCNSANQCTGCKVDDDCKGRSLTACKVSTGACVQCTDAKHCGGSETSCDTGKNQCVGCTSRSDCPGACQVCSASGTCEPVKNGDDPTMCTGTCDSTGQCKAKQGQKCTEASGCINNMACADGTCCDRACTGACEACDLPTALGICTVLPAGSTPHHGSCAGTGTGVVNSACGGSCQGKSDGTCSYPSDTTVCGTASCTSQGQVQGAGTCNGTGLCSLPPAVTCKTGSSCVGAGVCTCPTSLPDDCPSTCVNFNTDPKNCGACGHDCLDGSCLDGICQPVAVVGPATSYGMSVFGLDSQYLYYQDSPVSPFEQNHDRMNLSTRTVTSLRTGSQARGIGVIGTTVFFGVNGYLGKPAYCIATNCATTLYDFSRSSGLVEFGHPSPAYYSFIQMIDANPPEEGQLLEITWFNKAHSQVASWTDDVVRDNDRSFYGFGYTVYWIGEQSTTREVLAVDSTTPSSITRKRMAGQLPEDCYINDVNPQSLLLTCNYHLYRVPLPNGLNGNPPALVLSSASNFEFAIEDATSLYWADSIGSIYKCPTSDLANCEKNGVLQATSAPTTGFFQDAKYLYWGTDGIGDPPTAQILRMAK